MKKTATSFLLTFTCAMANADANIDRQSYCFTYGAMFQTIAAWRDQGASTEHTLKLITGVKGIPLQEKKDAIAAVYTDAQFKNAHGPKLGTEMRQRCLQQEK